MVAMSTPVSTKAAALSMLKPVIILNLWTFLMELKMFADRLPAMSKANIQPHVNQKPGVLDTLLPPHVNWSAHNYNSLMDQPNQLYAIALTLAALGNTDRTNIRLAWAYVALRIVHSLIQARYNIVQLRFATFAASSMAAFALATRAAVQIFS